MIDELIDEVLRYHDSKDHPHNAGEYFCSELAYCIRQSYYRYVLPMKETTPQENRVFARGNQIHLWMYDMLKNSDKIKKIENERSLVIPDMESGAKLKGRLDNLIETDEGKFVLEIKSVSGNLSYKTEPNREHVSQINPYMLATGAKGKIIYVDASNYQTKEFDVEYDPKLMQETIERMRNLHFFITTKTLPSKEALESETKSWMCRYCDYAGECKEDFND